jgi:TetR/AcrR family transcriptional regulator, cholesterol catabolism regulator
MRTATATIDSGTMRREILDVAAKLFRENGVAATTLRDVAKRCGIKAASIYHHFDSKDEILLEVLDFGIERIHATLAAVLARTPDDAPFEAKLRAAIRTHVECFFDYGDYTATNIRVFGQAPRSVQRRNLRRRDRYEDLWKELFAEGRKRGAIRRDVDLDVVRLYLFGAMNRTVEWYDPRGPLDVEALANRFADLLLHGIAPAPSARATRAAR